MIAVVGGTGRLGRLVSAQLAHAGERVRVVARSAPATPVPGTEFVVADLRRPATLPDVLEGADTVVAAAHGMDPAKGQSPAEIDRDGNTALIDAARQCGADIVLLSVVDASPDHPMELHRMKWAAEEHLREGGADWTIVRATAFAEMWMELLELSTTGGKGPQVFGDGENPINFVSVKDVAEAVVRAATDRSLRGQVIEVGGPEDLTLNDLADLVSPGVRPRHVPRLALHVVGQAARPVRPSLARSARMSLAMDRANLRFDPSASRTAHPWLPCSSVRDVARSAGG